MAGSGGAHGTQTVTRTPLPAVPADRRRPRSARAFPGGDVDELGRGAENGCRLYAGGRGAPDVELITTARTAPPAGCYRSARMSGM